MATLTIKNVGPIKSIENLELNKVNVFMGPQSSGKSTIAKIISFCTWLEKKMAREGYFNNSHDNIWRLEELKTYHRLTNGYFSEKSVIYYEGESIKCSLEGEDKRTITHKLGSRVFSSKVMYIPAERNFVSVIPNLQEYLENRDSIQDFINSWFEAKRTYNDENKLPILNLGTQYYSDSNDNDLITHDDGVKLKLQSASSGLQSIIPLLALFEYNVIGLYGKSRPMSVKDRDALIGKYNEMLKRRIEAEESIDSKDLEELLDLILSKNYINSKIIIEEPEQNLFPSTQKELIYYLLKLLNFDRGDSVTITTHSPYILYALNNCMMGYLVDAQLQGEEKNEYFANVFPSQQAWVNPKLVSVWEIEDGKLRNIQDKGNIISENYFDQKMTELTDEYYQMLSYYKDEE